MINVRNNVFETNSSSTHSVSVYINSNNNIMETIVPDKDGIIIFNGGDFSKAQMNLISVDMKANCIATYINITKNKEDKKIFESIVKSHTGAKKIKYDIYVCGSNINSFMSSEVFDEVRKIFELNKLKPSCNPLKNFLFRKKSWMEIGLDDGHNIYC